jgi:Transposase IS4
VIDEFGGQAVFGSPSASFLHFFRDVATLIVAETNRYAAQKQKVKQNEEKLDDGDDKKKSRNRRKRRKKRRKKSKSASSSASSSSSTASPTPRKRQRKSSPSHSAGWRDMTLDELLEFVSCLLVLGVTRRRLRRQQIWSSDLNFAVPSVQAVLPRARFEELLSHLHFADNETLLPRGDPLHNPVGKAQPLIDTANEVMRKSYKLSSYVSADECSKGFCGRKPMKHKPITARFGFNIFSVHCAHTSYMYQFELQHSSLLDVCQEREPALANIDNLHTMMPLYLLRDSIRRFDWPRRHSLVASTCWAPYAPAPLAYRNPNCSATTRRARRRRGNLTCLRTARRS